MTIMQQHGLNDEQKARFREIQRKFSDEMREFLAKNENETPEEFYRRKRKEADEASVDLFTPKQLLDAFRQRVTIEFMLGTYSPFEDAKFLEYLKIPEEMRSDVSESVRSKAADMTARRKREDRAVFDNLAAQLPEGSTARAKQLFRNSWR